MDNKTRSTSTIDKPLYTITETVWTWHNGLTPSSWHFVTIPPTTASDITYMFGYLKGGWGSIPVTLTLGTSTWQTSIFPDKKSGGYLIPIKSAIRTQENITAGDTITITIEIRT